MSPISVSTELVGLSQVFAVIANDKHTASRTQAVDSSFTATAVWAISATLALAIMTVIVAAPLMQASGHPAFALKIYRAFSYVCHQIPERSFHLYGNKFAVCSRCTGIYAGIALAALAYPLTRSLKRTDTPRLFWLFLAAAPLAIDWSLGYFSIWQNNHASRFATGFLLGAVAIFYILPGLIDMSSGAGRRGKSAPN